MNPITMIDPPEGWKYGFPRILPIDHKYRVNNWLVEHGYPQRIIDDFDGDLPCKYWESST